MFLLDEVLARPERESPKIQETWLALPVKLKFTVSNSHNELFNLNADWHCPNDGATLEQPATKNNNRQIS